MQNNISQDEINNIIDQIVNGEDDEYREIKLTRKIKIHDFKHPINISQYDMIKLCDKMKSLVQYFQRDFYKITGIDMDCSLLTDDMELIDFTNDLEKFKNSLDTPNYIREYRLDDKQLFIQVDPLLINEILIGRTDKSDITPVTKRLANQYFFDILKELLSNFSATPISEYEPSFASYTSYLQSPINDNIIENPQHLISNKNYNVSTYDVIMKCQYEDITGYITFDFDWEACLKFIGYIRQPSLINNQNFYDKKNLYASLGGFNLTEKDVASLEEGKVLRMNKLCGEPLDVIINNKFAALGEAVKIDYNYGVRIVEVLEEEQQININNSYGNTFVIFGLCSKNPEEIENIGEGTIIEFYEEIGDYSLLIHNNKIIAMGDIGDCAEMFTFKIAKIFDNQLYLKTPSKN